MVVWWWWGGGVVVVAHKILVSAQGPLVLVLGLRVWGQGLTIRFQDLIRFDLLIFDLI